MTKLTIGLLKTFHEEDEKTGANTYIVPIAGNKVDFIRDELCFVKKVCEDNFTLFRSLDGRMYTFDKDKAQYFKVVGRR